MCIFFHFKYHWQYIVANSRKEERRKENDESSELVHEELKAEPPHLE
jgi:hypothetical protein